MLAVVKKPHIELSISGENPVAIIDWLRKKFDIRIVDAEESVPVEDTEFYKRMQRNRVGNLLAGARHKAELTQSELASKTGISQNMISDYERGKRNPSRDMLRKLSDPLGRDMVALIDT